MLRRKLPPKILINLCIALILMEIFFVIGNKENVPRYGCTAISLLLQYFLLSVFAWGAVEGFQSFRGVVRPLGKDIKCFMQKAIIFGWGKY